MAVVAQGLRKDMIFMVLAVADHGIIYWLDYY
jgi:hypothetical protein